MAQQIITTDFELSTLINKAVATAFKEQQSSLKPDNTLLTQQQTAELLNVSIPTLQKMKSSGLIPYSQVLRKIYFRKQDVLKALESLVNTKAKS